MEKHFYNSENIEAYLENKLSASERSFFESEVSKDPLLKNEIDLQKDIIESLKSTRKAELKQRLSNIEVGMNNSYSGIKIAASLLLSGLLSYGIYSVFNNNEKESIAVVTESNKSLNNNSVPAITQQSNTENINASESANNNVVSSTTTSSSGNSKTKTTKKRALTKNRNQKAGANDENATFTPPEIVENPETEQIQRDETKLPEGKIAQTTAIKSGIDVNIDASNKKKFHYKYYDNKLFLFGNFDSKTYEIIELNTYKGKQVYLYFDKHYYQLSSNQLEISPLRKITDAKVIDELNKFNK